MKYRTGNKLAAEIIMMMDKLGFQIDSIGGKDDSASIDFIAVDGNKEGKKEGIYTVDIKRKDIDNE
jgi:hypothetical protein